MSCKPLVLALGSGGALSELAESGASCYPSLGSELRWAQPELQSPLLGNKHPCGNAKHRDLQFANPLGRGWVQEPARASWTWLSCGSCSPRAEQEHSEPQEAQGWQGGFYPITLFCSPELSLSWEGAGASTPLQQHLSFCCPAIPQGARSGGRGRCCSQVAAVAEVSLGAGDGV